MASIIGFDQEPGGPEGMGWFHFDDGRSLYAHEPEAARSVQQPQFNAADFGLGPQEDRRTASNGFRTTDQRLDAGAPAPGLEEQLAEMKAPQMPQGAPAPQQAPAPATGGGPLPPEPAPGEADPAQRQALTDYVNRPVVTHATKGAVVPKSQSQTVEQEGLPYDQDLADQRANANIDMMVAKQNTAQTLAARSQAEALQAQSQLPALQKKAALAQQEVAAQQDAYKAERADLDRLIAENQQNQKSFNANRWFESKSTIGQIGAVLAQAMGAYAATLGHGENWAQKIINQQIDADIQNQKMQIESGKENVNNALMKMKLRYGDMSQAEAALKIAMGQQADTQALAYAKSTGSQDIMNQWQEQVAKNQQDRVAEEQKFMAGALGKRKTTTEARIIAPSAGGVTEATEEQKLKRLQVIKGAQDVGALPDTSREGRALEIKRQADAAKKKNNPGTAKLQDQLDSIESSLRNAEELDKLYAKPGVLSRAERGRMEYLQDVSPLEVHKGLTGMSRFTETEGERYATAYGHKGETLDYTGKHRAALGALREDLARKRAQLQAQIASGVGGAPEGDQGEAIRDVE